MTTDPSQINFNDWADFWRNKIGVNVIPAITKYKKPKAGILWTEWQTNPIPDELHEQWKQQNQFRDGMAVIVGKVWHNKKYLGYNLAAIDCDNQKGIDLVCKSGIKSTALKTLVEQHPDCPYKAHVYFYTPIKIPGKSSDKKNPKFANQIETDELPALEIKGDGKHGIMYVTPSQHENGSYYEILGTAEPQVLNEDVSNLMVKEIDQRLKQFGLSYLDNLSNGKSMIPMSELLSDDCKILEGHNRHEGILRYAEHVYATANEGISDSVVFEMIKAKNLLMCKPPLEEDELKRQQADARKFIVRQNGQIGTQAPRQKKQDETPNHSEYADAIMQQYSFATLEDTEEVLFYHEGVYRNGGEIIIKKTCEQIIPDCGKTIVNEVIAAIQRRTYKSRSAFDQDLDMINMKNHWINIKTGQVVPHSSGMLSRVQLPVFYDPTKRCEGFMTFLAQCLPNEEDRFTVIEQISSCLIRSAKFGKAFMWIGQGMNGKSTALSVIEGCLGPETVSHISIHSFEDNRFAKAELDAKLANIYADISNEELNTASEFKALVTGDPVLAEKKNKNPFVMINHAKMFFSANQIPIVYDESDGFFRRFMIIEWNQKFDDKKADKNLKEKLLTEDEKSGIFNLLLKHARDLDVLGYFRHVESVDTLRARWKTKSDSIKSFLDNELVYDENYIIPKGKLYESYKNYCVDNKLFAKNIKRFHDDIKQMTVLIDDLTPHRIDGKSVRVWKGAALKRDMPKQEGLD